MRLIYSVRGDITAHSNPGNDIVNLPQAYIAHYSYVKSTRGKKPESEVYRKHMRSAKGIETEI
jgi:hypothetical protein